MDQTNENPNSTTEQKAPEATQVTQTPAAEVAAPAAETDTPKENRPEGQAAEAPKGEG